MPAEVVVHLDELDVDPYPTYARLRRTAPVAWVPSMHTYFVTRWADVRRVARDAEVFSAEVHDSPLSRAIGPNLLHSDDPRHAEQRAPLTRALRPSAVAAAMAAIVDAAVADLLADVLPRGRADLITDFAENLSLRVLREVSGLPPVAPAILRRWVDTIGRAAANYERDPAKDADVERTNAEIDETLAGLIARGAPDGSIIAAIAGGRRSLPDQEFARLCSTVKLLIIGGIQEPRDLFGTALHAYLTRPDVRAAVDRDPQGAVPRLVEESLRWGSPVGTVTRQVVRPVELSGTRLDPGVTVAAVLASANRDESRWTAPDDFDIDREDLRHMAFAAGVHACVGAALARTEVRAALTAVIERCDDLRLTAEPAVRGWEFRGPTDLHVAWRPRKARRPAPRPQEAGPLRLVVKDVAAEARGIIGVRLGAADGTPLPAWSPGDHLQLELPDGRYRSYSLCGPPDSGDWYIAIQREDDGRGGSRWLHDNLAPGLAIGCVRPRGNFPFVPAPATLFIAGGIGITPILPMVERAERERLDWRLLYVAEDVTRMPFLTRLPPPGDGRVTLWPTASRGRPDLGEWIGRVPPGGHVYCCGPAGMLDQAGEHAGRRPGVRLHTERFAAHADATLDPAKERAFDIRLTRMRRTIRVDAGETALAALERAGVLIPSTCREGTCGSCETAVLAGRPDHRDVVLSPKERAAGRTMMPCVSRALDDIIHLDL
ncbi:hypothetical protein DP939_22640 [Spongiactinospora rosea]|uniref:Cytochrome P450 n=1 Tax=Spongiactinospora rosea TaxID=2248750 RepID=A0A366LWH5_9ACTN|nr:cytochrome P450 [Spongiactinospora rosea]RBQ17674.1 hypothetical protein DP939_22640 [Spongiactinospora rosea]